MVPWCFNFALSYVFLGSIKMSKLKHLIKVLQCLYIYTEFCSMCHVLLTLGCFNGSTLSHWGLAKASALPEVFAKVPN